MTNVLCHYVGVIDPVMPHADQRLVDALKLRTGEARILNYKDRELVAVADSRCSFMIRMLERDPCCGGCSFHELFMAAFFEENPP